MSDYEYDEYMNEFGNDSFQWHNCGAIVIRGRIRRERNETKVIAPGKIVPYKRCPPSSNVSVKRDFYTAVLFNYHCHTFSGTSCNVY